MRRVHSLPLRALRASREPGVPALLDCCMNRFHIPIDTSFCIPTGSQYADRRCAARPESRTHFSAVQELGQLLGASSDTHDLNNDAMSGRRRRTILKPELPSTPSSSDQMRKCEPERGFGQLTSQRIQRPSLADLDHTSIALPLPPLRFLVP